MSDAPHLQIADVAQVMLPATGADLRVFREAEADLAPEQLTVVGHLEAGESLDLAARRETEEESGVRLISEQPEFCGIHHHCDPDGGLDRITAVFAAQSWMGEPHKREALSRVSVEKPLSACPPRAVAVLQMLAHGPSHRGLNWPTPGGSE
ncbi:NUDIX domain-containing protein [Streptomyces sp. NBC_01022]|uniref:NUDIX domain-containing protein n=1 Tax=Streptomyces sp. NBC_01022 TaxID=2903723 RepID=UPI002DDC7FB9|nr:NUDIX domain-containing protein [Streptomyces sp. NBC_01022]WRZ79479.1 NUDIX domain-containing protein [Streptomyces sp. NBC_01022]WRZ86197.1 NUDIX domain-containing protein [Streptomyces sp. NBC_01022]